MQPINEFQNGLLECMLDDLNISKANAYIDIWLSKATEILSNNPTSEQEEEICQNLAFIESLLGIGGMDPDDYFKIGFTQEDCHLIDRLLVERTHYKSIKDFGAADAIRDHLITQGVAIIDSSDETYWEGVRVGPGPEIIE